MNDAVWKRRMKSDLCLSGLCWMSEWFYKENSHLADALLKLMDWQILIDMETSA